MNTHGSSETPRRPDLPRDATSLDLTPEVLRHVTEACTRFALDHVGSLEEQPSWDLDGVGEVAARLCEPAPETGAPIESLLETLGEAVSKSYNAPGPGYLAYIPGGGVYPAALGDYMALAVNRYVGVWNAAPALVQMESTVIDWMRELVDYPEGAGGLLTSGGSMSNLIAMTTARRTRLGEDFLDAVLYVSEEAHHSLHKAALLAGFRQRNLRSIPVDERYRMLPDRLDIAIREDRAQGLRPFLVVASAGTTNTGAVDPTPEIADLCDRHDLWLHVDAAYGGFFRLLQQGHELLPGLERADSLVLDPHKGLFLPYGTGCLLVRDPELLRRAHSLEADYLQDLERPQTGAHFADLSPELSREFRGLRLWLPLKLIGASAFRDNLQEKLELARWAYDALRQEPGFECLDEPQLSIVAFRYVPQHGDADHFNAELQKRVHARRRVFLSSTRLRGQFVLRICVLCFRTHGKHVQAAVEDLVDAARELEATP